jgi:cytochrome c556
MGKLVVGGKIVGLAVSLLMNVAHAETAEEPLELRNIMQGMQVNMQKIEQGIAQKDWELVSQNALSIAEHPAPPLFEKLRIFAYMNTNMGDFKALDKITHATAKELAELALRDDKLELTARFTQLKESCEGCHSVFRAEFQANFYN